MVFKICKFEFFCRFDEILNNLKLPLVPDTDGYLLYTNAKEFAQLCHSFELNAGDIQKLKTCAEIIVDLYSSVPDLNITPKFHNILHYWQDAAKFGSIYRNSSPLIEDLKYIMNKGINKTYKDDTGREIIMNFKICVSAVCGDNKGIYELLGYHTL
ncbi:hypothetical protein DERP_014482, partial [Dermatophagoides pteronyssinus]